MPQGFSGIQQVSNCVIGIIGPDFLGKLTPKAPSWCQLWGWYCGPGACSGVNFFRTHDCSMAQVQSQPMASENNWSRPAPDRGATNSFEPPQPKSNSAIRSTE